MTSARYPHLFSPVQLGPVTVSNRLVFSAHLTNFAVDGLPTDRHAAYYAARAAGGVGLVITEEHSIHGSDRAYEKLIQGFRPEALAGYRRLTVAVHAHDVPVFAQLNHNGGQASGRYTRHVTWAPSPVADPQFREVPKAVDAVEIATLVAGYADVAGRCRDGGFDGIELQCSHSSIIRGFLSPATNRRTDGYGGSVEGRSRFLIEVVAAVREAIGPALALGVRLGGDELIDDGITLDDAVAVAQLVTASGGVDYINTSIGLATASLYMIQASMAVPRGYALFIPTAIRRAVDVPVIGVGRFSAPDQAEQALVDGHADLIGVVRGQIADPEFAAKARAGVAETIRTCLSCNQECVGRVGLNRSLGCLENPQVGREVLTAPTRFSGPAALGGAAVSVAGGGVRSAPGKRVMVVGGGPGGMQAALSATRCGHVVTVYEASGATGGQVRTAARAPSRSELGLLIDNQLSECIRLGVEVVTATVVDLGLIVRCQPDAVIVATGARARRPPWVPPGPGSSGPMVADVRAVLDGAAVPRGRVVVVDELGFHQATSVAEVLADGGCEVQVVAPGMIVGQDLGLTLDREMWWRRATEKGIVQTADTLVTGLYEGGVEVCHLATGLARQIPADWVVVAAQQEPVDELYFELKWLHQRREGPSVVRIGDCVAPRRAQAAILEGDGAGASL